MDSSSPDVAGEGDMELFDLRVTVDRIEGRSVCGMQVGDYVDLVNSAELRLPDGKHFCVYALQAVLPLLPMALIQSSRVRLSATKLPSEVFLIGVRRASGRSRSRRHLRSLSVGPLIASSRAFVSSSSVVEGRQAAPEF